MPTGYAPGGWSRPQTGRPDPYKRGRHKDHDHDHDRDHDYDCRCGHCHDRGCGHDYDCRCDCCIKDADYVVYARCFERRLVPIQIENDTRKVREDVTLEVSEVRSAGGRVLPWKVSVRPQSPITLPPCSTTEIDLLVEIDCDDSDDKPEPRDPAEGRREEDDGLPAAGHGRLDTAPRSSCAMSTTAKSATSRSVSVGASCDPSSSRSPSSRVTATLTTLGVRAPAAADESRQRGCRRCLTSREPLHLEWTERLQSLVDQTVERSTASTSNLGRLVVAAAAPGVDPEKWANELTRQSSEHGPEAYRELNEVTTRFTSESLRLVAGYLDAYLRELVPAGQAGQVGAPPAMPLPPTSTDALAWTSWYQRYATWVTEQQAWSSRLLTAVREEVAAGRLRSDAMQTSARQYLQRTTPRVPGDDGRAERRARLRRSGRRRRCARAARRRAVRCRRSGCARRRRPGRGRHHGLGQPRRREQSAGTRGDLVRGLAGRRIRARVDPARVRVSMPTSRAPSRSGWACRRAPRREKPKPGPSRSAARTNATSSCGSVRRSTRRRPCPCWTRRSSPRTNGRPPLRAANEVDDQDDEQHDDEGT